MTRKKEREIEIEIERSNSIRSQWVLRRVF